MKTTSNFLASTLLLLSLMGSSCSKDDSLFPDQNGLSNEIAVREENKFNTSDINTTFINSGNRYGNNNINKENAISEPKLYAFYLNTELSSIRKQIKKLGSLKIRISNSKKTLKSLKAKEYALLKEQEKNNYFIIKLPRPLPPCPFVFSCTPKPDALKNIITPNYYKSVKIRFFNRKGKLILESGYTKSLSKIHPDFFILNTKRAIYSKDAYRKIEVIKTDHYGKTTSYKVTNDNR